MDNVAVPYELGYPFPPDSINATFNQLRNVEMVSLIRPYTDDFLSDVEFVSHFCLSRKDSLAYLEQHDFQVDV